MKAIDETFGQGEEIRTRQVLRSFDDDVAFYLASAAGPVETGSADTAAAIQAAKQQGVAGDQPFPSSDSQVPERFSAGQGIAIAPGVTPVVAPQLLADLRQAMQDLSVSVLITDALRPQNAGYGAKDSRHHRGKALDIGQVNGRRATLGNSDALRLAQYFIARGYVPGSERGAAKSLLFGPVGSEWNRTPFDHTTHIHLSLR